MGNTLDGQSAHVDVVIIGGGPTGLGAAYRLNQYGFENWLLLDAEKHPGGLAGSVKTAEGFRFDHGYKALTSRYEYFDKVLSSVYNEETGRSLLTIPRNNYVYIRGNLVKYPVQNNLGGLPIAEKHSCVLDLVKAKLEEKDADDKPAPSNLDEYLVQTWGEALCNIFFRPYIFKAWAYPTGKLRSDWVDQKIPPADLGADFDSLMKGQQRDPGWGIDASSAYPSKGGMIGLWRQLAKSLPTGNVRFKHEISQLDIDEKKLVTKSGLEITYKQLISSMPLTSLLDLANRSDLTECMVHSSLFVVCLGLRGTCPLPDVTGCIFYPESDTIFHRVCVFSTHDPDSIPASDIYLSTIRLVKPDSEELSNEEKPGPYWSLMMEISGGPLKSVNESTIADDAIRDACAVGLLKDDDEVVSIHLTEMTHGYPLPTINSVEKVDEALRWLKSKDIWSRGRFGAFRYEVGDLDHCFIQGVEAVDNMLKGIPEDCVFQTNVANNQSKLSIPAFDVNILDDVSQLNVAALTESFRSESLTESLVSDDATDPVLPSDSEQSIAAGSIRSAITAEPNPVSDSDSSP
ncbi:uncharacterized protein LOC143445060 isoform X2 [Clavelina lepadiformis]|uniref:Amine oxidase domain-containing protein n=1 Tax=Clavelina lepadiformis TaxID=159417 RepID=A0ABP0FDP4_CLALP